MAIESRGPEEKFHQTPGSSDELFLVLWEESEGFRELGIRHEQWAMALKNLGKVAGKLEKHTQQNLHIKIL